jgi:LysR family transcriptional regulator, nitrogen assimilation regulatory protein
MELRQLRYFLGVVEAGSLLKASGRLHVAQPALGQQIADLENEVGARLFDRSSRGMAITDAGKVFLEHAQLVLADVERARNCVRDATAQPRGVVVVGLPTTVALVATMPILKACRERYPLVQLKVVEAYSGFLQEWLQNGRLDIAFLFGDTPEPGLNKRVLLDETLAYVTHTNAPCLPKRIALSSVVKSPLVLPGRDHGLRRIIDEACTAQGLQLNVVAEIESLVSVKKAVEAGIGSTVLSSSSVAEEVAAGRMQAATIDSKGMTRRVVCATNVTRPASSSTTAVQDLSVKAVYELVAAGVWPAKWLDMHSGVI